MSKAETIDLFISACEPSADTLGASLLQEIQKRKLPIKVEGILGPKMRAFSCKEIFPMEKFQVMGFKEVCFCLPKLLQLFFQLRKYLVQNTPKRVLFIDYPEFHLKLESSLKKKSFPGKIFHFVSPSVWAWRKKRADILAKSVDHLFTLFPFEKQYYSHTCLKVDYVGHPLAFQLRKTPLFKKNIFFSSPKILVIFPGSRKKELEKNLPIQLAVARKLQRIYPHVEIAISCANPVLQEKIRKKVPSFTGTLFPAKENYLWMRKAYLAFATSGTISLELALHETPSIISYAIGKIDLFLAQKILRIRLPFYTLANILLQREVFPELLGPNFTEKNLFAKACSLFVEEEKRNQQKKDCGEIKKYLKTENPSQTVIKLLFAESAFGKKLAFP